MMVGSVYRRGLKVSLALGVLGIVGASPALGSIQTDETEATRTAVGVGADRGWVGIYGDLQFTSLPNPGETGFRVLVTSVHPEGPAARSGMLPGDHIVAFSGEPLTYDRWLRSVTRLFPGDSVWFTVTRNGRVGEIRMAAESRPDLPQELAVESARLASYRSRLQREVDSLTVVLEAGRVTPSRRVGQRMTRVGGDVVEREGGLYDPPTPVGDSAELRLVPAEEQVILEVEPETIVRRGFLRITSSGGTFVLGGVQPREPAEARDRVALEPIPAAGVVIMRVVPGSLADQIGFRQGDIITAAAGYSTPTTEDLNRVLQEAVRPFDILVFRDGGMMTLRFR